MTETDPQLPDATPPTPGASSDAVQPAPTLRQFQRFVLVGPVGVALGWVQYRAIYQVLAWLGLFGSHREASTWLLSAVVGIAWCHALHCRFTFRETGRGKWLRTLPHAYAIYAVTTIFAAWLIDWLAVGSGMQVDLAWGVSTMVTSCLNFLFLRDLLLRATRAVDAGGLLPPITPADVTVVVPTKDEEANIVTFLESLPPEVDLVVVDASEDETPRVVRETRPENTRVVRFPGNIPEARQLGAQHARTRWVLFTDADVSLDEEYFAQLRGLEVRGSCGGIVGTKLSSDEYLGYHRWFRRMQHFAAWFRIPAATGSNMLITREALRQAGGFNPLLTCNEDSEVMFRVQRSGYGVKLATELVVWSRDHRRLRQGVSRKWFHSIVRCTLLYVGLLPSRWQGADWGYWQPQEGTGDHG